MSPTVFTRKTGARGSIRYDVVRLNDAHVAGYEKLVGTKTTIWVQWICYQLDHNRFGRHGVREMLWRRPDQPSRPGWDEIPCGIADPVVKAGGAAWPTTGIVTLTFLLQEFPVIHLLNWYRSRGIWTYYWSPKPRLSHKTMDDNDHNPARERAWIERLQRQGRVVLVNDDDQWHATAS